MHAYPIISHMHARTNVCGAGSRAFLKEQKGDSCRFTLMTSDRELKLRSPQMEFKAWAAALLPLVGEMGDGRGASADDDDD